MGQLESKKIAILATDGFEQSELTSPRKALEHEGAIVEVIAPHEGTIRGWKEKNWAESAEVTRKLEDASAQSYDALVLPGGVMNPDQLRSNETALQFVKAFVEARKPIAAICHGPWTLVETGMLKGRQVTSYRSLKTDLTNAGARWVDEAVVSDRGLVTSRTPGDLLEFNQKMIEVFALGPQKEAPARKRKKPAAASGARAKRPVKSAVRVKGGGNGHPRRAAGKPAKRTARPQR
jgi:protease I